MAKQMSELKEDFVQKYKLDDFVPRNEDLPAADRPVVLGEYCEPKDSIHVYNTHIVADSDDGRYADPQDSVKNELIRLSSREEDIDVYELALQPDEQCDVPPPAPMSQGSDRQSSHRKPSPKPRGSTTRRVSQAISPSSTSHDTEHNNNNASHNNSSNSSPDLNSKGLISRSPSHASSSLQQDSSPRRRLGKQVVEIEYEVASAIRPGRVEHSTSKSSLSSVRSLVKTNSVSESGTLQTRPPQFQAAMSVPVHAHPSSPPSASLVVHPSQVGPETLYEEPWDLKVKRLRQEEEDKRLSRFKETEEKRLSQLTNQNSEMTPGVSPDTQEQIYDAAWDSPVQKQKFEQKVNFARSLSTASEAEVFHDAVDSTATKIPTSPSTPSIPSSLPPGPKPLPSDTYEDAWDLKNSLLEQKIREMQVQASVTYEEPWDNRKQQEKLQTKMKKPSPKSSDRLSSQKSSSEAHTQTKASSLSKSPTPNLPPSLPPNHPTAPNPPSIRSQLPSLPLDQPPSLPDCPAPSLYETPWDRGKQQEHLQAKLQKCHSQSQPRERPSDRPISRAASESQSHAGLPEDPGLYEQPWDSRKPQMSHSRPESKAQRSSPHKMSHKASLDTTDSKSGLAKNQSFDDGRMKSGKVKSCNIGQRINPMIPLVNQNWFHGNISRDDAEKMLCVCKEGSYIVRISSDRKSYSLSIKSAKQYIHVQIEELHLLDGSVRYILGKNSKEFPSIPEMIDHYTHHRVPLKGAEHITLMHPVECKWS